MESEIIDAIIFMCLGIGFHYFKIYMDKLYLKKKDEYNHFLKEDKSQSKMEYHKRTAKIEIFSCVISTKEKSHNTKILMRFLLRRNDNKQSKIYLENQ
jgi:S-adenosylmethionine synthetase